jgi:hypothetical protein
LPLLDHAIVRSGLGPISWSFFLRELSESCARFVWRFVEIAANQRIRVLRLWFAAVNRSSERRGNRSPVRFLEPLYCDDPDLAVRDGMVYDLPLQQLFASFSGISNAVIPSSVEVIAQSCFEFASALQEVALENGSRLHTIEGRAFVRSSLARMRLPNNVRVIEASIFEGCTNLHEFTVEANSQLEVVGVRALSNCPFAEFVLSRSVVHLTQFCFGECESLSLLNFELKMNLKKIDQFACSKCGCLKKIALPGSIEFIDRSVF